MNDPFFNFEAAQKCEAEELNIDKDTFERRCYETYQLHWMLVHKYSINDLLLCIEKAAANILAAQSSEAVIDGPDAFRLISHAKNAFENGTGFDGNLWVSKERFLCSEEFHDPEYMKLLTSMMADGKDMFDFYQKHYLKNDKNKKIN